jgi:hypothetical protein
MRRAALLALLAVLAGCGGGGGKDRQVQRAKDPSTAHIEHFAHIKLPPSARDVKSRSQAAMDESLSLSFVMDRGDLDAFVKSARFTPPLERGYQPYAFTELGWNLDKIKHTLGGKEDKPGFGRELVIDLDKPDVATVYLIASET